MALTRAGNQQHFVKTVAAPPRRDRVVDLSLPPQGDALSELLGAPARPTVQNKPAPAAADRSAAAPLVPRRGKVSHRGKQPVTFSWPASRAAALDAAHKGLRGPYRQALAGTADRAELTRSHLFAAALERALAAPGGWLDQVPNDWRRTDPGERLVQVGLVWPAQVVALLDQAREDLETGRTWPEGFALTKANLALAGIEHALAGAQAWIGQVPNDDRYTGPAPGDGRTLRYAARRR